MFDPYRRRREKASFRRARQMGEVNLSLPVDGDAPAWRTPTTRAGEFMETIVADLVKDRSPFYDEVSARWRELFPELAARPGKWVADDGPSGNGRLFLHVRSAAASFALRPKIQVIRKKLMTLGSAPRRFSVHIEIVGKGKV